MDAGPPPAEVIKALRRHELALSSLYETFARLLPDMAVFWHTIAKEERAHAEVLVVLGNRLPSGVVRVDRTKFTFAGIESAIEFVNGRNARFSREGVTREAALATAIDAERGALEHSFYSLFQSKDPDMLAEFDELAAHTKEHQKRLEDEKEKKVAT